MGLKDRKVHVSVCSRGGVGWGWALARPTGTEHRGWCAPDRPALQAATGLPRTQPPAACPCCRDTHATHPMPACPTAHQPTCLPACLPGARVQAACSDGDWASFRCEAPRTMPLASIDPSLALGFYCGSLGGWAAGWLARWLAGSMAGWVGWWLGGWVVGRASPLAQLTPGVSVSVSV